MTRLREEDISGIGEELAEYDQSLLRMTGKNLAGIAAQALGKAETDFAGQAGNICAAVIPISSGEGVIGGFSETVQRIIRHLGIPSFVTEAKDVGGLMEAVRKGARIIFLGDDDAFAAINMSTGKVADNGEATGKGYAAALDLLAGGIEGREVLLLGAGPVGMGAAQYLVSRGARVRVRDLDEQKAQRLTEAYPEIRKVSDPEKAFGECRLILDATPAADSIDERYIRENTCISAPGIPLGFSNEGMAKVTGRLVHDALEIGVATMLLEVL